MHINHRRKKGSHNPKKGRGWSNRNNVSFSWAKTYESRRFRRRARYLIQAKRYAKIQTWPMKPSILWDWW